tara:strand:+ start:2286 stop:2738 length:453 start_codon:yes stop_codon:yes gene_type:complete
VVAIRVRIDIGSSSDPTHEDILTTLRGLPSVITVNQEGPLQPGPSGKQWANLVIKFENTPGVDVKTLGLQIERLPTVDMTRIVSVDGTPWDIELGKKDFDIARSKIGDQWRKKHNLGTWSENPEAQNESTIDQLRNLIKETLQKGDKWET